MLGTFEQSHWIILMKKFVFCKVVDYMSTNVLKSKFLECIFQGFWRKCFQNNYSLYFILFLLHTLGKKTIIKRVIIYGLLLLSWNFVLFLSFWHKTGSSIVNRLSHRWKISCKLLIQGVGTKCYYGNFTTSTRGRK